jgi:two-component system response regulator HydG
MVDDDRALCETLQIGLRRRGFDFVWRATALEALDLLREQDFDVVVTDLKLDGMDGFELCRQIAANRANLPVVVLTAFGSLESAVTVIRAGAYDFATKPIEIDDLALVLERAVQHRTLTDEVKRLRRAVKDAHRFEEIIGSSPEMQRVYDLTARVAETEATVLITGESGTGKELIARALHQRSRRSEGPFVAINCAAMPETLLESELFGHVKGAFTDARAPRTGLLVAASGGTLFLDEIGDMPTTMQAKLLRALQERAIRPVGGETEVSFDTRIVASTNRNLENDVAERRFREDLFYRINVVRIHLPPLRARGSDVLQLAQCFLEHFAERNQKRVVGLSPPCAEKLLAYAWPGNVRELQNCMERAVALARFEQIGVEDLPENIRDHAGAAIAIGAEDPSKLVSLGEMERRYVLHVLEAVGGNKTLAARILHLDRRTLYRRLENYGLGGSRSPPHAEPVGTA